MKLTKLSLLLVMLATVSAIALAGKLQDAPNKHDVSALAWMSGLWMGASGQTEMEEQWTTPKGGMMLGVHRDVKDGRARAFEFMRIQEAADGVTYWASPGGKTPVPFRATEISSQRVVFENKEHDFPQRVIYWLTSDGMLHAKIEGMMNGKLESEEWAWKKQ